MLPRSGVYLGPTGTRTRATNPRPTRVVRAPKQSLFCLGSRPGTNKRRVPRTFPLFSSCPSHHFHQSLIYSSWHPRDSSQP